MAEKHVRAQSAKFGVAVAGERDGIDAADSDGRGVVIALAFPRAAVA